MHLAEFPVKLCIFLHFPQRHFCRYVRVLSNAQNSSISTPQVALPRASSRPIPSPIFLTSLEAQRTPIWHVPQPHTRKPRKWRSPRAPNDQSCPALGRILAARTSSCGAAVTLFTSGTAGPRFATDALGKNARDVPQPASCHSSSMRRARHGDRLGGERLRPTTPDDERVHLLPDYAITGLVRPSTLRRTFPSARRSLLGCAPSPTFLCSLQLALQAPYFFVAGLRQPHRAVFAARTARASPRRRAAHLRAQ